MPRNDGLQALASGVLLEHRRCTVTTSVQSTELVMAGSALNPGLGWASFPGQEKLGHLEP
jgi:hypothetical protein